MSVSQNRHFNVSKNNHGCIAIVIRGLRSKAQWGQRNQSLFTNFLPTEPHTKRFNSFPPSRCFQWASPCLRAVGVLSVLQESKAIFFFFFLVAKGQKKRVGSAKSWQQIQSDTRWCVCVFFLFCFGFFFEILNIFFRHFFVRPCRVARSRHDGREREEKLHAPKVIIVLEPMVCTFAHRAIPPLSWI